MAGKSTLRIVEGDGLVAIVGFGVDSTQDDGEVFCLVGGGNLGTPEAVAIVPAEGGVGLEVAEDKHDVLL